MNRQSLRGVSVFREHIPANAGRLNAQSRKPAEKTHDHFRNESAQIQRNVAFLFSVEQPLRVPPESAAHPKIENATFRKRFVRQVTDALKYGEAVYEVCQDVLWS